ncbi:probable serine/threonine-protein kinase clkA [Ceratitis capitata]|uniref:probable serine/threonine-protein kinase clkA n=1 Tax=Ceratitis capitata TaxID=7213 RepID=UPI00032980BD|nr:probable serine/threonine-protein kinase clkA [Ceratitis capitata]XP_012159730.1 probable serine/threonine-protein kinase clkA [Ceratitis capitata]
MMLKMRLRMSCLLLLCSAVLHCVSAASASTVGLYAPDRYNGIPETCLLPMDFGYCRAKVKRYYFDMRRMKCAMFYFGGCAGNVNNFKTLEECNRVCLDGYGDYDSPNDVVAVKKPAATTSGRDYRSRGNVNNSNNSNNINSGVGTSSSSSSSYRGSITSSSSSGSNVGGGNIKNNTSATSYGVGISSVDANYKNTYNKYNSNLYNTHIGSNVNGNNSGIGGSSSTSGNGGNGGSGSGVNNSTKIIRNRSDDNLDEYDYEEN